MAGPHFPLSRRRLLSLSASGLLLPTALVGGGRARAAPVPGDRKFLFIFNTGGWDPTECLAPMIGTVVEGDLDHYALEAHGIPYVTSDSRPDVTPFFETWGPQCALLHGIEARSVAHDVCLRLILTGSTLPARNDWPSRIAAAGDDGLLLPMVHISGPSYTGDLASEVVRVGGSGQLAELLNGDALLLSEQAIEALPDDALGLADGLVEARLESAADVARRGRARTLADQALRSEQRMQELFLVAEDLDLAGGDDFVDQAAICAELFERGLARSGMVEFYGTMGLSWDTHAVHSLQGTHFNTLLGGLSRVLEDLASRAGTGGGSLLDETTVVVMSEMGRYPKLNSRQGKEHWTYTSAMLLGAGVRGGTVVGGYDAERFTGQRVDLETGELRDDGVALLPQHLGASLLTLAGMDPEAELGPEYPAVTAMLS